ncbi:MAG: glycosyl hydrolase [Deltaproteobacteria bacterium]|nr:glycosyl hydrolase [Deltaproteobacteria bacterium]
MLAVPALVNTRLADALGERNLVVQESAQDAIAGAGKTSAQRIAKLSTLAPEAQLLLLIELKAVYFDELQGQFRWVVYGKLTAQKRGDEKSQSNTTLEEPVFLLTHVDREVEALQAASDAIARRAANLLDGVLSGPKTAGSGGDVPKPFVIMHAPRPRGAHAQPLGDRGLGRGFDWKIGEKPIYFVLVDRFANGDRSNDGAIDLADPAAFHGGDLQGVIDHLDYLKSLGIGTLWLSPVFEMRTEKFFGHGAFHGYWTRDLHAVEPRFGGVEKLIELSLALHERDMRLVLDLVVNHVAFDAPLVKQHPDWFHHNGEIIDWNDAQQLVDHDVYGLPDLAQENPEVHAYLLDVAKSWIDVLEPDGFRLDAVKHVPLAFWKQFNAELHDYAGPDFFLLGEALESDPGKLANIWREGGFDSVFDFPLAFALTNIACKGAQPTTLDAMLAQDQLYPDASKLVTLLDNHDLPRLAEVCGGDAEKIQRAVDLLISTRGTPSFTYGTEAGLRGTKEPENRGDLFISREPECTGPALRTKACVVAQMMKVAGSQARFERKDVYGVNIEKRSRSVRVACRGACRPSTAIVGLGPALASWNPAQAKTLPADLTLPVGMMQYKLVRTDAAGKVEWSPGADRFTAVKPGDGVQKIEVSW